MYDEFNSILIFHQVWRIGALTWCLAGHLLKVLKKMISLQLWEPHGRMEVVPMCHF